MFKLQKGDKIGIISPSSLLEDNSIEPACRYLMSLGFDPVIGKHVYDSYHYMAGTDEKRASDIMAFFTDSKIKALFCTRGGAGSLKILPLLDYDIIKKNPKPIFGFSDSTALQNGIYSQTQNISYSGFLLIYDFRTGIINSMQDTDLKNIFAGKPVAVTSGETVIKGKNKGTLVGGNIYAFNSLCGTPYFPDLKDKILLLEDTGIKSYQLDLMLHQLKMQKGFHQLKGLIFGKFENIRVVDACDGTIDDNINYFCRDLSIPVIKNFDYGHIPARHILPIGRNITLNADNCTVSFEN